MDSVKKEITFMILQFLAELNCVETQHRLEQDSKIFFNRGYFYLNVLRHEWEIGKNYLSAFTTPEDNVFSKKMFSIIQREKQLKRLQRSKEPARRDRLFARFKKLVESNPRLQDKLALPDMEKSRLQVRTWELISRNQEQQTRITRDVFNRELISIILLFLEEENFEDTHQQLRDALATPLATQLGYNLISKNEVIFPGMDTARLLALLKQSLNPENDYRANLMPNPNMETNLANNVLSQPCTSKAPCLDMESSSQGVVPLPVPSYDYTRNSTDLANVNFGFGIESREKSANWKLKQSLNPENDYCANLMPNPNMETNLGNDVLSQPCASKAPCLDMESSSQGVGPLPVPNYDDTINSRDLANVNFGFDIESPENDYRANLMPSPNMETNLANDVLSQPCTSKAPCLDMESSSQGVGPLPVPSYDDTRNRTDLENVNFGFGIESTEKSANWKLTEIKEPSECRTLVLPDVSLAAGRIVRLIYSHCGNYILGLTNYGMHKLWRRQSDQNWIRMENATVVPQLYQSSSGIILTNQINVHPDNAIPLFAPTTYDSLLWSVLGRKMSMSTLKAFKAHVTLRLIQSCTATYFSILPLNDETIALGYEDIEIYSCLTHKVQAKLKGHQKQITCLAFSAELNVLVSSGADAQLFVWSADGWEKKTAIFLKTPTGQVVDPPIVKHIEFNKDRIQLLVVHERQISIYATSKLVYLNLLLFPEESSHPITHATYSCRGESIFVSFKDGRVGVYACTTLQLRCMINQTVYTQSVTSLEVYPLTIVAHPCKRTQFSLVLTNGRVHVLEPLEPEGEWGTLPPPTEVDIWQVVNKRRLH